MAVGELNAFLKKKDIKFDSDLKDRTSIDLYLNGRLIKATFQLSPNDFYIDLEGIATINKIEDQELDTTTMVSIAIQTIGHITKANIDVFESVVFGRKIYTLKLRTKKASDVFIHYNTLTGSILRALANKTYIGTLGLAKQ